MSTSDLIEQAVCLAEAEDLPGLHYVRMRKMEIPGFRLRTQDNRSWTKAEMRFLRENYYRMTLTEIAAHLGRTEVACKIKIIRKRIPRPSKRPGWLTGNKVAHALGSDIHAIMLMYRRGILPMDIMPGERGIMLIKKLRLYMWCINPMHWPYFRVENMNDQKLQRLVKLAQSRWGDEWLPIGQAGEVLGVDYKLITNRVRKGKIPGVRWGNTWVRRSVVEDLVIHTGKGRPGISPIFTPRADEFLLRMVAEGKSFGAIGRMMKINGQTAINRYRRLKGDQNE